MKQRQTPYLMNNNQQQQQQRINTNERDYISQNFNNQSIGRNENSYGLIQEQKLRFIILIKF